MSDPRIIQRGLAKVETTAGTLDAYVGVSIQSIKGKHQWDGNNVKDFGGFEVGWDARNSHIIINVSYELTAASFALAKANGAFLLEFAKVSFGTSSDLDWINTTGIGANFKGDWCYHEGGSVDLSNTKCGSGEISLRKFKDETQNNLQFTIPA